MNVENRKYFLKSDRHSRYLPRFDTYLKQMTVHIFYKQVLKFFCFIFVRSRKKLGDPGSTPMTSHIGKEKKKVKKVQHVDLDKVKLSRGEFLCQISRSPVQWYCSVLSHFLGHFLGQLDILGTQSPKYISL